MKTGHTLVCPFLNDNPLFAYGVEFGMLWARMQGDESDIHGYFCMANQEQVLLAANRLRWRVLKIKPWGKDWFWLEMERAAPSATL